MPATDNDVIDRTWNQWQMTDARSIHTSSNVSLDSARCKKGNRQTILGVWLALADGRSPYTPADILLLLKLCNHYRESITITMNNYLTTTSALKHAILTFLYQAKYQAKEVAFQKATKDIPDVRGNQRSDHERIMTLTFRHDELEIVRPLIIHTRQLHDRLKSIRDIITYYEWLNNPVFDIKLKSETIRNNVDLLIINNAYAFSLKNLGDNNRTLYFLRKSHSVATKCKKY